MTSATFFRGLRGLALVVVGLFFLFPFVWVMLMSFMTNQDILRSTPTLAFSPTLDNYASLISGQLKTDVGTLPSDYMHNLWNSFLLSS